MRNDCRPLMFVAITALYACSSASTSKASDAGATQQQQTQACVFEKRDLSCMGYVGDWQRICLDGDCVAAFHSDNCQPNDVDPTCIDNWECRSFTPIDASCAEWESRAQDGGAPSGPGVADASIADGAGSGAPGDASGPALDSGGPAPQDGGPAPSPGG